MASRDPGYAVYLLPQERLVVAMHRHWIQIAEPLLSVLAGLVVVIWVDLHATREFSLLAQLLWYGWFFLVVRLGWRILQWRLEWFVATDKRLLLTYGLVNRKVAMMPFIKVTDMSYARSVPGLVFRYGKFVLESAGQEQAMREINWIPDPNVTYRRVCAEIFGFGQAAGADGSVVVEEHPPTELPLNEGTGLAPHEGTDDTGPIPVVSGEQPWPLDQPFSWIGPHLPEDTDRDEH
jgi:hypothetical protein